MSIKSTTPTSPAIPERVLKRSPRITVYMFEDDDFAYTDTRAEDDEPLEIRLDRMADCARQLALFA